MTATDIIAIIAATFSGLTTLLGMYIAYKTNQIHANTKPWEPPIPPTESKP